MKTAETPVARSATAFSLKRILVPVDFSAASKYAVECARQISGFSGADLIFLHVVVPDAPLGLDDLSPNCAGELRANAQEDLRSLVRAARNRGSQNAKPVTRCGLPTHEIVEEAKESDVDLIVIATHGYTGWKHFCIGSTAERVVRAAPCPVLVVREKEHPFWC